MWPRETQTAIDRGDPLLARGTPLKLGAAMGQEVGTAPGGVRYGRCAVAHEFDRSSVVFGSHEAAITNNVGSEDSGQPALYALFAHGKPIGRNAKEVAV